MKICHFHWTGNSLIFIFIARDRAYFHVWTSVSVYQTSFILARGATIALHREELKQMEERKQELKCSLESIRDFFDNI